MSNFKRRENLPEFASKVYDLWIASGLSGIEIAEKLGIPKRTFEGWRSGSREPTELMKKIIIEKLEKIVSEKKA